MSSKCERDDDKVANAVLDTLNPRDKVCIRFIAHYNNSFFLLNQFFGNRSCPPIFIANRNEHFFLANLCPEPVLPSQHQVPFISPPDNKPKTGYSADDFGPPPDLDYLDWDDQPHHPADYLDLPVGF